MKDGMGRFASFTLGVANSAAQKASRTASRLGLTSPRSCDNRHKDPVVQMLFERERAGMDFTQGFFVSCFIWFVVS